VVKGAQILPAAEKLGKNQVLKDKYVIKKFLGEGGLAYNYLAATTRGYPYRVVIKQTKRVQEITDEISEDRFQMEREFRLLYELDHDQIPRVYETFEIDNVMYFVREYRNGELLEDKIKRGMKEDEIQAIAWQILDVLEYLHSHGIIYRDLKPSNIIVDEMGRIFIIDFGTARFHKMGKGSDTIALGTPGFAAPEQYGRSQTDESSDIYSFGALLYYMLSQDNPEDNPFKIGERENLNQKFSDKTLIDFLSRCLFLDPRGRYQSVKSARNALFGPIFKKPSVGFFYKCSSPGAFESTRQKLLKIAVAVIIATVFWMPMFLSMFTTFTTSAFRATRNIRTKSPPKTKKYAPVSKNDPYNIEVARSYLSRGEHSKALEYLNKAEDENPQSARTFSLRGLIFLEMGSYDSAIYNFNKAVSIDPDNPTVFFHRGIVYQQKKDHLSAICDFDRSLQIEDSTKVRIAKAYSYIAAGHYNKALDILMSAQKQLPTEPTIFRGIGLALSFTGDYEKSLKCFNKALMYSRYNNLGYIYENRGWTHVAMGQTRRAREDFENAISINPNLTGTYSGLSFVYLLENEEDKAIPYLKKTLEKKGSPEKYFIYALIYGRKKDGDRKAIREYLKKGVKADPDGHSRRLFAQISKYSPDKNTRELSSQIIEMLKNNNLEVEIDPLAERNVKAGEK